MKESQILCVAFLYINMLHFPQQRVKMQFPSWSIDVVAGSGGPVCRSQCAGAQCAWLGRECTVGHCFLGWLTVTLKVKFNWAILVKIFILVKGMISDSWAR